VDLARFLVEHGADITAQGEHGRTPLCWALYHKTWISESCSSSLSTART